MPIVGLGEPGGGLGTEWGDESGGQIVIQAVNPDGTHLHRFRVNPFDASGNFTAPPSGTTTTLNDEAGALLSMMALVYASSTTLLPYAAYKVTSGGGGVEPFSYVFDSTLTTPGTASGSALTSASQLSYSAHGSGFSRWGLHLFGYSSAIGQNPSRNLVTTASTDQNNFGRYLSGALAATGIGTFGVGKKTNIVTHAGEPIVAPMFWILSTNKRMRRRLKIA